KRTTGGPSVGQVCFANHEVKGSGANSGRLRRPEIPSLRSSVFRTRLRLFTQLAERAVTPFRRRAIRGRLAKSRVRIGRPFASQYLLSHSDLILARSTFDGHSVLRSEEHTSELQS